MSVPLALIGREKMLFTKDIQFNQEELYAKVSTSKFLVLGGAGLAGVLLLL